MINYKKYSNKLMKNLPSLHLSKIIFKEKLLNFINEGKEFTQVNIINITEDSLKLNKKKFWLWHDKVKEFLTRTFTDTQYSDEFSNSSGVFFTNNASLNTRTNQFIEDVCEYVSRLESILNRLEFIPDTIPIQKEKNNFLNKSINHDNLVKIIVAIITALAMILAAFIGTK